MNLTQALETVKILTQFKNQHPDLLEASLFLAAECERLTLRNQQLKIQRDFFRRELAKLGHNVNCNDVPVE